MSEAPSNPCIRCGACCISFRVSFYWAEADDAPGGHVPAALTEQVTPFLRAMCGTHPIPTRCVGLEGTPGDAVNCAIYENRPSTCREFNAWMAYGTSNPACTRVRNRIGLPALDAATPTNSATSPINGGPR